MIDHEDFVRMREELAAQDANREHIIKRARDPLKASKQAIFCVHRNELVQAEQLLASAHNMFTELLAVQEQREGALSSALEEYVEAKLLLTFVTEHRLLLSAEIPEATTEEYLLGLCDFTGELGRCAVHAATVHDKEQVERIQQVLDALMGELLQFDFRNGELRRKYDGVKYALQKVEQLRYELSQ